MNNISLVLKKEDLQKQCEILFNNDFNFIVIHRTKSHVEYDGSSPFFAERYYIEAVKGDEDDRK